MRKKMYKAKKNWIIGVIAGTSLLISGGGITAHAATNAQPAAVVTSVQASARQASAPSYGLNLYDQNLTGVNGYENDQLSTRNLDSNVQVTTKGDTYGSGSLFPRTINSSRGLLVNKGLTAQYYYYNQMGSKVDYLNGQDATQEPVTSTPIGNEYISKTSTGDPANISENVLGTGTLSDTQFNLNEHNTLPMPSMGGSNQVSINKQVQSSGNTTTVTVNFNANGDITQPGAFGIEIRPDWYPNNQGTFYNYDYPYVLGNCFYYIIKDLQGNPAWVEVLRPLNGTRVFAANQVSNNVDPILGGRKVSSGVGFPDGTYLFMNAPEGLNSSVAYQESYYSIPNYNLNDQNNYGHLDGYSLSENNQGQAVLHVSGWHASNNQSTRPYSWLILFDNTTNREIGRQRITNPASRPDVERAYPQVIGSGDSGFNADFVLPANAMGDNLTIVARFSDNASSGEGNNSDIWLQPFSFEHANHAWLDGVQVNNGQLNVSGWNATNLSLGRRYHYIILLSNGREVARQLVRNGQSRNDVARAYPQVINAAQSGFNTSFTPTQSMLNGNLQILSRWTDDPAGNGNYVDYWFSPIDMSNNQGYLDSHSVNGNSVIVSGWNATNAALVDQHHTLILFDNTANREVTRISVNNTARADVARAFPTIQTASQSGFTGTFQNVNLQPGHRYSLISRYSLTNDANSNYVDHWFDLFTEPGNNNTQVTVNDQDQGNYGHLDELDHGDASEFIVGWHASNQARNMRYHFVIVLNKTTGQEIARVRVTDNNIRNDVARAYPQVANARYSGFNLHLQFGDYPLFYQSTSDLLQIVSRWTNDPAGNGQSVDYYFTPVHWFP